MKFVTTILQSIKEFYPLKEQKGKKRLVITLITIIGVVLLLNYIRTPKANEEVATAIPQVSVLSVAELTSDARFDTIGKVEAVSEANLQSEAGGRITSVSVTVGDKVAAGQVIATLDNKLQRAALTQAQGGYEAALAGAAAGTVTVAQAETGLESAKDAAVTTYKNAYNTTNSAFNNNIDNFFALSNATIIGLKIDGQGYSVTLNNERTAFRSILPEWQRRAAGITTSSDLDAELSYATAQVDRTIKMVDIFITIFNTKTSINGYSQADLQANSAAFTQLRAGLLGTRASIDAARAGLKSARDGVKSAELAASGGQISAADAQVKIALGTLQTAQASFEKTLVRSPINGTVNALYLKAGDYTAPGQPAAIIANNGGLQIKTFVNEADSATLTVGDQVTIEGTEGGIITAKAAALDPSNGKIAVVIGVKEGSALTNGATVKVTFTQKATQAEDNRIIIPLAALKVTGDGGVVFTVTDSKLVAVKVELGELLGDNIEIKSGIAKDTRIVTDARGLKDGQTVTVTQ